MPRFLLSEPAEAILSILGESLDLVDFGIVLLNRDLRMRFMNRKFIEIWAVTEEVLAAGPFFRDLLRHGANSGWYPITANAMDDYLAEREAAVRAGPIAPTELELTDGRKLLFRCLVSPDGGRILTYADITNLAEERELLRQAREAAERIGLDLKFSNESLESQASYLASLAEAAEEAAHRAEDARQHLEREIVERRRLEEQLRRMATTDGLTGALNRMQTMTLGQRELERTRQLRQGFAVFMIDLDHFKSVNDRFGHPAGDVVLQQVVAIIGTQIRRIDRLGRLGGEEFGVVLPAINTTAALQAAERVRAAVAAARIDHGGTIIPVTVSIGVAKANPGDASINQVFARADVALYRAKMDGRNRVSLAEELTV